MNYGEGKRSENIVLCESVKNNLACEMLACLTLFRIDLHMTSCT